MINLFTSNKTRRKRIIILEEMLDRVIKERMTQGWQTGLCTIVEDCISSDRTFIKYLKKQRPTKFKNRAFFAPDCANSMWWWRTDFPGDSNREMFIRHLIKQNKPFKIF